MRDKAKEEEQGEAEAEEREEEVEGDLEERRDETGAAVRERRECAAIAGGAGDSAFNRDECTPANGIRYRDK